MTGSADVAAPLLASLAARLADASLQGAVFIAVLWIVCALARSMRPATRTFLWWLASAKFLAILLAVPVVGLPLLPASAASSILQRIAVENTDGESPARQNAASQDTALRDTALRDTALRDTALRDTALRDTALRDTALRDTALEDTALEDTVLRDVVSDMNRSSVDLAVADSVAEGVVDRGFSPGFQIGTIEILVALWLIVVCLHAVALVRLARRTGKTVRRAGPITLRQSIEIETLAARLGMRCAPTARVSDEVQSLQVIGVWRPCILIPAGFAAMLSDEERRMALCHELVHVRRADLLFGWIPALAERLFFFHPLARVAAREYLVAREAACDAAVVRALDADPHAYARMLVRLGIQSSRPQFAATVAPPTRSSLRRRLQMLHLVTTTARTSRLHWCAAAAALLLVPLQLTARAPQQPAPMAAAAPAPLAAPAAPAPAPQLPQAPLAAPKGTGAAPQVAPAPLAAPAAPAAPQAVQAPQPAPAPTAPSVPAQVTQTPAPAASSEQTAQQQLEARARAAQRQAAAALRAQIQRETMLQKQYEAALRARQKAEEAQQRALDNAQTKSPTPVTGPGLNVDLRNLSEQMRAVQAQVEAALEAVNRGNEPLGAPTLATAFLDSEARALETRLAQAQAELSADHPRRVALEQQLKLLKSRQAEVSLQRANLVKQRAALLDAQKRLAEAEAGLRAVMEETKSAR